MGVKEYLNYEAFIGFMDKQLQIWGQPVTVYQPSRKIALGYEDTNKSDIEKMGSDEVLGTNYKKHQSRIWINFTITKNVFYKFNWMPEDGEELCMAVMNSDCDVHENDYIRTAIPEATSIWGDMIFSVRKIQDIGFANVLQRLYFLKPTNNADLHQQLDF